jgi:phosphoadenosine phosphosulfate reductase
MEPRQATANHTPQQVLKAALTRFDPGRIAISFSGAEDVVLIDMAHQLGLAVDVFSLDTGRLHPETYKYLETVRNHYNIELELLMPQPEAVADLVREKGLYSFYEDGHGECCAVRKIEPLRRKLNTLDAWITGQRRDQSVTRSNVPQEQEDQAFSTNENALVKFNPLADWSSAQVWSYIHSNDIPYNELHEKGFVSIGCEPCTRAIAPHEHERAGRWWWEEATQRECGLHAQNVIKIVG